MDTWHRRYNVSGTVHCGNRLDRWCAILRDVLAVDDVSFISHMTGDDSIIVLSTVADVASSGNDVHFIHAYVHGEHPTWIRFVAAMKAALYKNNMECSLTAHDSVENLP